MTWSSTILICRAGSGDGAGPATTAPLVILNSLPWHGQSMVPLVTLFTRQPTCVHTALNALYWPPAGWGTPTLATASLGPPPTGISLVAPSTVPFGLGLAFFLADRLAWPPRGEGLDDMAAEPGAAGLVLAAQIRLAPRR